MIRSLVIGDPHIRNKEIEYTDLMIAEILRIAAEQKPHFIVVLGDTLDTFDKIRGDPLCRAIDFLGKLSDIAFLVLLIGNHDLKHNQVYLNPDEQDNAVHPFTSLKRWKNTLVCDVATVFEIEGIKFCGVPYVPMGKYAEAIANIDRSDIRCFFSHQDFYGVRYKLEDAPSTVGDPWPSDLPLNISGHIHEEQILAPNLIYVGTPIQQDYGASPNKGVSIFTFYDREDRPKGTEGDREDRPKGTEGDREDRPKGGKDRPTEDPALGYEYHRIPLVTVPLRKQYTISASDLSRFTSVLEELKNQQKDSRVHLTKIVITGAVSEIATVMSSSVVKSINAIPGVKIVRDPIGTDISLTFGSEETEENSTVPRSRTRTTFISILHELLLRDVTIKDVYNNIFPENSI